VFFTPGNIRDVAAAQLAAPAWESAEARQFLGFFAAGKRSFARARRAAEATEE
jgi:UDP-N-acetylglucosamine acyltransferase